LRKGSYSSHTVKKYIIPFAILSGALIATDTKTADLLPNTLDQTRWSGRVSQAGASYSLAGLSAGTFLLGKAAGNRHAQESGWLALHAIAHTQIVVFALKQMTNRERPLTHEGGGGFWAGGDSFPSGHAATSFAVATVFAYEYRNHIAVPITAYTLASAVAASRLSAQRHWISDIVVGGTTGFLIGRFVYKRHHDPALPGSPVNRTDRLVPQISFGTRGVSLAWHF
jgi:membrane-associated phospholipid phosphatase